MASDAIHLIAIISILVAINLGGLAIYREFSGEETIYSTTSVTNTSDVSVLTDSAGGASYFKAILGIFLWSFGLLPVWLDVILLLLRTYGYILIARVIRGV